VLPLLKLGEGTIYPRSYGHHLILLAKGDIMVTWKPFDNGLQLTRRYT
jgi:hypothetical protein